MDGTTTTVAVSWQQIQRYLQAFDFKRLFVEVLGWDNLREAAIAITCDSQTFVLRPLVEKRGMKVYVCGPDAEGNVPRDSLLRKIESELTQHAYEHIIVYVDAAGTQQVWQWVKRGQGKTQQRLNRYYEGQSGALLAEKLRRLAVAIDEEHDIHTAEMNSRTAKAFDVERVTKRFYDRFKLEHSAFLQFIQGITSQADREWYASLMLNRLMFIYFIQRKGFLGTKASGELDGDIDYLSHRLQWVQEQHGADQFHSFYHHFLLKLFHDGLSKHKDDRTPELKALLGNIPYLNGGLFDTHTLERTYPHITIPDKAFEHLFAFFNEFTWHLDDRPLRNDREINPDVLGYIFEKYINQKQMGAYYTKEDITDYISKNTIVPYIFDAVAQKSPLTDISDWLIWSLLRIDPDRYIYDAMKKGCKVPLPPAIEAGVQDMTQRGEWNKPAPEAYALPTEIWREVVARRTRYADIKAKLATGEITSVNDLITYNLDIVTFAEDAIAYCKEPELLRAFYDTIKSVTVLDPTCGSGAFLFAALNILERLYEVCLDRMQQMIDERDQLDTALPAHMRQQQSKLDYFRCILREAATHPSREYFIYKSIIVNNLYGVDIMEEATEICKLRLFLKLVSQVKTFNDIEPLPDIDFNIRAGNTLVGFASYDETKQAIEGKAVGKGSTRDETAFQGQMIFDDRLERIEQRAQEVERAFEHFRKLQTELQLNSTDMSANKQQMREKLGVLRTELDGYLASEYSIDRRNISKQEEYDKQFAQWQQSHQPFHWWVEFYGIMKRGGFDVIIGNPPYVEYKNVKDYRVRGYAVEACGDLFAFTLERGIKLTSSKSRTGFIVPMSCFTVDGFASLQEFYFQTTSLLFISNWSGDAHPSKLFEGVDKRLSIVLARNKEHDGDTNPKLFTSKYLKWYAEERAELFHTRPIYEQIRDVKTVRMFCSSVPKIGSDRDIQIINQLHECKTNIGMLSVASGKYELYYTRKASFFLQFLDFVPELRDNEGQLREPSELKVLSFSDENVRNFCLASLSSSLFYWYYIINSDCRNLNKREIISFPSPDSISTETSCVLKSLLKRLMDSYRRNSTLRTVEYARKGNITVQYFNFRPSKPIIDEIDRVLAEHYGFTDEELDFIINYDIKYRMGRDNGGEGEE